MSQKPLTYADAGVSIEAGNALVKAIGPLARSTARPGADAELGGFGGFFDLKAAGYRDPLLVAANDGVGTKLKLAIETGRHDGVGIDLVAMCANDLDRPGRRAFVLPRLLCHREARQRRRCGRRRVDRRRLPAGRMRADRRRNGRNARHVRAPATMTSPASASGAVERDKVLTGAEIAPGDVILGLASSGVHSNGFSLVRRIIDQEAWDLEQASPIAGGRTLGEVLLEPTRIYVRVAPAAGSGAADQGSRAHHRRRTSREYSAGSAARLPCHRRSRSLGTAGDFRAPAGRRANRARGNGAHLQLRHRHGRDCRAKMLWRT